MTAIIGLGLIFFGGLIRWSLVRSLQRRGEPTRRAWHGFARSPTLLAGVVLVVAYFNATAGGALIVTFLVTYLIFLGVLFVRGVRGFPAFWRGVRRIREPEAWRGN